MTIHVWKHWFWITLIHKFFVLLLDTACAEAGLLAGVSSNLTASTHYDIVTTTPTIMADAPDSYASDMDDTYNGESEDMVFPIPLPPIPKKYPNKYSFTKKYKSKAKPEEAVGEKVINYVEEKYDVSIKRVVESNGNATESNIESTSKRVIEPANDSNIKRVIESDLNATESVVNGTDEALGDAPADLGDQTQVTLVQNITDDDESPPASPEPFDLEGKMAVAAATTVDNGVQSSSALDAGSITGITLGIVVISALFGAISFVLYRRRYLNKPQVLNDKSSTLDSSGYIDDASLRENSEEMYSLDNDSFLNSLEAMTIQNYWTESVKHTKL